MKWMSLRNLKLVNIIPDTADWVAEDWVAFHIKCIYKINDFNLRGHPFRTPSQLC